MSEFLYLIIGGALTIAGGIAAEEFRARREQKSERKAIITCFVDEMNEIEITTKNMHEVWEKTGTLHSSYVNDMLGMTSAYDAQRLRLFLIKDASLRKDINFFYKKLKDTAKKADGKIGTLADTDEAKAEQNGFNEAFQKIGTDAKSLRERLERV